MKQTISLQSLKKMSAAELLRHWGLANFPFDWASCSRCLTQHTFKNWCPDKDHKPLSAVVKDAIWAYTCDQDFAKYLLEHLDELYAARLFYRDFYAHTPQIEESKTFDEEIVELSVPV